MRVRHSWDALEKPGTTEALVYLACWEPRHQKEIGTWIHGERPTNEGPIIRGRRSLERWGYLKRLPSVDLRRSKFLSDPAPFIEYAVETLENRRSSENTILSAYDRRILVKITDSNWFRVAIMSEINRLMKNRRPYILQTGALRIMAEFLEEISVISFKLGSGRLFGKQPKLLDLLHSLDNESFDSFMNKWSAQKLEPDHVVAEILRKVERRLISMRSIERERIELLIRNTISEKPFPALCIPLSLSDKLQRIGRIPLTFSNYLDEILIVES